MILLHVDDLRVEIPTADGIVSAADGVTLQIGEAETHCLIGESGCGKTIVALSIMRLLPKHARIYGKIIFNGIDLLKLNSDSMQEIRGRGIAMIFEQPQSCLNPVFRVGNQIAEAVRIHDKCSMKLARERALDLMALVKFPNPKKYFNSYPHEYSGGMAQRAMIAMAMAFQPCLLIADEPTTSLDAIIQNQIMELLMDLVSQSRTSLLLITHNIAAAFEICEHASVMYAGFLVEQGFVKDIVNTPGHPYTSALLGAVTQDTASPIDGRVPLLTHLPGGCPFHPRCRIRQKICSETMPQMAKGVRCHLQTTRSLKLIT